MKKLIEYISPEHRDKVRFGIAITAYILWVIWLGNYWFLLGAPVIFDIYISKKVNWTPWKKREGENSTFVEWLDALIFAVVAVTLINIFLFQNYRIPTGSMEKSLLVGDHLFVSKVAYGPKTPNTPLFVPFTQNVMPLSNGQRESYLKWIQWEGKRLKGLRDVERYDVVVFNFPEGDTVIVGRSNQSYYGILHEQAQNFRQLDLLRGDSSKTMEQYNAQARKFLHDTYDIVVRPLDRRDNYIKRCVAIHGDTLQIINGRLHINSQPAPDFKYKQYSYLVKTNGTPINSKKLDKLGIYPSDRRYDGRSLYEMPLTKEMVKQIETFPNVVSLTKLIEKPGKSVFKDVFPRNDKYAWNQDNFGPLYVPEKGATININTNNLPLYKRVINYYEGNTLEVKDDIIYINGEQTDTYTFQQNYYWMMGDNRQRSLDSRFWGFVPQDHIVGSPKFIWLSLDKSKSFPANIRFKRFFKSIK